MSKIAFCFLTYNNLSQPKLYNDMIINNKNKLNYYIYSKETFDDPKYNMNKYCIDNRIDTSWGTISLVKATLMLFLKAYESDEENEFFMLLSDKCVPLYDFNYIYNKIFKINSNIISIQDYTKIEHIIRYNSLVQKNFFSYDSFMKQSQWMCLNRNTIKFFLDYNFIHIFGDNSFIPVEHYFINICINFNINFHNMDITFANWHDKSENINSRPFPKTYEKITDEDVKKIKLNNNDSLFMRKISNMCILPPSLIFDNGISMNNILYVFFTHSKNLLHVSTRINNMMNNLNYDNYIIVCGNDYDELNLNKKLLYIKCNDLYEGLPEKIIKTFNFLVHNEYLQKFKYFCKLDDDMSINVLIKEENIKNNDYCGRVNRGKSGDRNWHIGKCSKNSLFNITPYKGEYVDWCLGGYGYIVSANAITKICEDNSYLTHIYEDLYIAILLKKQNILPADFDIRNYITSPDHK